MTALTAFRVAVMADADAQQRLCGETDPAAFATRALEWAAARGIALETDDLAAVRMPDVLGIDSFGPAPQTGRDWPPAAWLPTRFVAEEAAIDWGHFAGQALHRSFFAADLHDIRSRPFNRLFRYRTPFDAFLAAPQDDSLIPDGFIFHMSRCGSTLVAQMLAALPDTIVVSEAEPLDMVVQLPWLFALSPEVQVAALRAMVAALGRNRSGTARRYVVKLDAWHALALPLFRRAFPDVPWVFLYRDPVEVLVSQQRDLGQQIAPGALAGHIAGLTADDATSPPLDFAARVLAAVCEAAASGLALGGGQVIDYRDLPGAVFERILPHFGIVADATERAGMTAATARHAKAPGIRFEHDATTKQREADGAVRAAAAHLAGPYARLQSLDDRP